jgi:hypothetical protein
VDIYPPKAKAAVCVPAPAKYSLAVFKLPLLDVQLLPSYSSVAPVAPPGGYNHQKLMLLFEFLHLLKLNLAVFKVGLTVVQVVPSYSSVAPVTGGVPPKAKAAV